ncbi:MAG: DUF72 domain-containing protein [Chloroflexota bacterium]
MTGGRLFTGTSGFSYPAWAPRFYPPGTRSADLLREYSARLAACELNNTFYARPTVERIKGWIAATPESFRFVVKGQRGASLRALGTDASESVRWLLEPLPAFGERLGAVLFRVPDPVGRDDDRLASLLRVWPREVPLVAEFQHASWDVDETHDALREAGAVLCATDLDDQPAPPSIRVTGPFLYLRLRRTSYTDEELDAWAARVVPFIDAGLDAYVIFRHDEDGTSALRAEEFPGRVAKLSAADVST